MLGYLVHRILIMIPTLIAISIVIFVIIQLPPGDYFSTYMAELQSQGEHANLDKIAFLKAQYGFDQPLWKQYLYWAGGMVQGDMGYSFLYDLPVNSVVGDRLLLTFIVSFTTIVFTYLVAFPIGVYSATHQYSLSDYLLTFVGFLGLATPSFLLALVLLYLANVWFGISIGGLMDPVYVDKPWSWGKILSVAAHLWIPVIVIGTAGTAAMIRRLRANLLDELQKQYVVTARAKGLHPLKVLFKYPLRLALNPFIADIGSLLPHVISGAAVVSIVMSLPTTGPMLLEALRSQDMFLAGSFLMFMASLTVIGVFLSDLALAALDPRIRLQTGRSGMSETGLTAGAAPERAAGAASPAGEPIPHYVSRAPFDPYAVEAMTATQERYYRAPPILLMWWRFRRHRVAVVSGAVLLAMYVMILFCEFLAPYGLDSRHVDYIYAPPQAVHVFHDGRLVWPYVYGYDYQLDMTNLRRVYTADPERRQPIRFFCRGDPYYFWGLVHGDLHLACPPAGGQMFLLGADRLGRDLLSRIIYGARISLTVGLIGVTVSFLLGIVIGGIAGYYGGWTDMVIQRAIEVIQSFPHLPLWMALSAVLPVTWSPLLVYFGITIILGMIEWTHLARAVRSKLLALREEDFCTAAVLMGAKPARIIGRHLLPSFMSHLIASATLTIPGMILGETALSFLGLGLRPPITSWGVLLNEAQNISVVALYPWLMLPVIPVILTVLAFNFLGDGLRDAADPYH